MNENTAVTLYPYSFSYRGEQRLLFWFSDEQGDCFVRNNQGDLQIAQSTEEAFSKYPDLAKFTLWDEAASVSFDIFWSVLEQLDDSMDIDENAYSTLLNGWNFIEDLIRTFYMKDVSVSLRSVELDDAYKKIFYNNNIVSDFSASETNHDDTQLTRAEARQVSLALSEAWNAIDQQTNIGWGQRGQVG
ncbi:MAG: hypothetical protein AAF351_09100 [Pseudomonadota bacterium]